MRRPGDRLRRAAARLCSERVRQRLIDPAVADLQAEVAAARRGGSASRLVHALSAGYVSLVKVLIVAACGELRQSATTWERGEMDGALRAALIATGVITAASVLLALPFIVQTWYGEPGWLALYLIPSTLPLSVPLGLAVATAWALHGAARTARVASVMLFAATLASAAMFVNMAWIIPDANQTFREGVVARFEPPQPVPRRGENELPLSALRDRVREARAAETRDRVRDLESTYYRKWAMSAAPLAIVGLIVAFAFNRPSTRGRLTATACAVFAAQSALWMSSTLPDMSIARPILIEWVGPALCAAATVAITCSRWRARRAA